MPLQGPPTAAGSLADLPAVSLAATIHRVWTYRAEDGLVRESPWWFASIPDDTYQEGGRFDLPAPMGTCYTATTAVGAVLEALQAHLANLPRAELEIRRRAEIGLHDDDTPPAADLTDRQLAGRGITAALWASGDRQLTQAWAAALRRDGWWILHSGIQHDPSGQLRGFALFDHAGAHPPSYSDAWVHEASTMHDDAPLHEQLSAYGITVRDPGDLPFVDPA